jgi:tRNA G10  N-methylase Trm11
MTPSIHPFPARMAPELALKSLERLQNGVVLDPMTGSGTVARMAKERGLTARGFDLDPLAVLISNVATTRVDDDLICSFEERFGDLIRKIDDSEITLPWMDGDPEAERFVNYWFGERQQADLRRIAYLLHNSALIGMPDDIANVFRVALSRIIVTKKQTASLAQDTSHSRPHRVTLESDYDVLAGFSRSLRALRKRIAHIPTQGSALIRHGDARDLITLADESIDAVLTSPPYLNAIDYMRGHRLSLIWLGHRYEDLRFARSNSIGAERRSDLPFDVDSFQKIKDSMGSLATLPVRYHSMIERYVLDLHRMMSEVSRVMKAGAYATFVMGNSCLRGVFVRNSEALAKSAEAVGLVETERHERELPSGSRYLPTPTTGTLGKRMRKEVVLTFAKA